MRALYLETAALPPCLQAALKELGYHRTDIRTEVRESFYPGGGGSGYRTVACVVNLATGKRQTELGSWGGANMFTSNPVDGGESGKLPEGFAAITGVVGHKVLLSLTLHPANAAPLLPAQVELSAREQWILAAFSRLTSAGRKNEWERRRDTPTDAELDSLAQRGYLKRARNGATQVTTSGRNAAPPNVQYKGSWL